MTIYYNAQDRKPLVKAISEFTGADAIYMRTPTYAYQIDYFTVTREGNRQRQVRIPLLSPAARVRRLGVQSRAEDTAEKPHSFIGFQKWGFCK